MTDHELNQLRTQLAQLKRDHAAEVGQLRGELADPRYTTETVDALLEHLDADAFDNAWEDRLEVLVAAVRASKEPRA